MAVATLKLPSFLGTTPTAFTGTVAFSSTIYRVRFVQDNRANGDAGAVRMDLRTADGTAVLLGLKVLLTDDLWDVYHYKDNVPPGALRVRRLDGTEADPVFTDLAGNVVLEYVT